MKKKGFTLLEVLVVIIIIGILAALALPQYMKTIKKARVAEATSNIGSIKGAEIRYYQENGSLTEDLSLLDVEDPGKIKNAYFSYTVSGDSLDTITIEAKGSQKIMEGVTVTYSGSTGQITITGL
jgi:type IV pilus assembly protein PilA